MNTFKRLVLLLACATSCALLVPDVSADARIWKRWKSSQNAYKYYARSRGSHFRVLLCYQKSWSYGNTSKTKCSKKGLLAEAWNGISGSHCYSSTWKWYARAGEPDRIDLSARPEPADADGFAFAYFSSGAVTVREPTGKFHLDDVRAFLAVGKDSNYVSTVSVIVHQPGRRAIESDDDAEIDPATIVHEATATFRKGELIVTGGLDRRDFDIDETRGLRLPFRLPPGTPTPVVGPDAETILTANLRLSDLLIKAPPGVKPEELELTVLTDTYYELPEAPGGPIDIGEASVEAGAGLAASASD